MKVVSTKPLTVEQINRYVYQKRAVEEFPLQFGGNGSYAHARVFVRDIEFDSLEEIRSLIGMHVNLLYVDLPWGGGITSQFRKRAGMPKGDYATFRKRFCELAWLLNPDHIVLEMGDRWVEKWVEDLKAVGIEVVTTKGTYYRKSPMTYMVSSPGSSSLIKSLSGVDDMDSPGVVMEKIGTGGHVVDLCCGRGTTAFWAMKKGWTFTGVELDADRASGTLFHVKKVLEEKNER